MNEQPEQSVPPQVPVPPARDAQIMIFATVSAAVVGIVVLVLAAAAIVSQFSSPQIGTNSITGPFNTLARPLPRAQTVWELLPAEVGEFTLGTVTGSLESGYTAIYTRGEQTVDIAGRLAVSMPAAQFAVDLVRQARGDASEGQRILPGEFNKSYYLDVDPADVRFAWSRELWYFDVRTTSLDILTAFMRAFPY